MSNRSHRRGRASFVARARAIAIPRAAVLLAALSFAAVPAPGMAAPPRASGWRSGNVRAFVRVDVDKERAVVGERIPFRVTAYFAPGTSAMVTARPSFEGDAFLVHGLDDAVEGEATVRGERWGTLTWKGTLTPAIEGTHPVRVEMPAELSYREIIREAPLARDYPSDPFTSLFGNGGPFAGMFRGADPFAGAFGGSLFDDFEQMLSMRLGPVRTASVELDDEASPIEVVPPPTEGRPEDFTGAIGSFEVEAAADASSIVLGEPVTITLTVSGEGNLDRLDPTMLEDTDRYRAYAPTSEERSEGGRGEAKVFEQSIVPTVAGELVLPPLALSYFDPESGRYATVATEPIRVDVRPRDGVDSLPVGLDRALPPDGLAENRSTPGSFEKRLLPLPHTPWIFIAPAMIMLMAWALPVAIHRRDGTRARRRQRRRRTERTIRSLLRDAERAAKASDPSGFYVSARAALQHKLSLHFDMPADAVTLADVETQVDVLPKSTALDDVRTIFERADASLFAGNTNHADLTLDKKRLEEALRSLELHR